MKIWPFFVIGYLLFERVYADEPLAKEANYMNDIVHMLGTLFLLFAFVVVALFFVRKMMRSRLNIINRSTSIKILERRPLHSKASLYLIEVLGKVVLISDAQGEIRFITEINGPSPLAEELQNPPKTSFKDLFQKKLSDSVAHLFKKPPN